MAWPQSGGAKAARAPLPARRIRSGTVTRTRHSEAQRAPPGPCTLWCSRLAARRDTDPQRSGPSARSRGSERWCKPGEFLIGHDPIPGLRPYLKTSKNREAQTNTTPRARERAHQQNDRAVGATTRAKRGTAMPHRRGVAGQNERGASAQRDTSETRHSHSKSTRRSCAEQTRRFSASARSRGSKGASMQGRNLP